MTRPTDEELNVAAAAAMGYVRDVRAESGHHHCYWRNPKGVVLWRVGEGSGAWSPAANIEQAFMVQSAVLKTRDQMGEFVAGLHRLWIATYLDEYPIFHWFCANAPPRARVEAALKALASHGGGK